MIMSERDSVHKEIEKLQEEVSLLIRVCLTLTKRLNVVLVLDESFFIYN